MKDFFFRFPFWSELNWSHLTLEFNLWTPSFPTNLHSFWGPWQPRRRPVVFGAFYEQSEGERKIACCAWRLGQPQPIYTILAAFCSLLKSKSKWHVNKWIFVCELIWTGQVSGLYVHPVGGTETPKNTSENKNGYSTCFQSSILPWNCSKVDISKRWSLWCWRWTFPDFVTSLKLIGWLNKYMSLTKTCSYIFHKHKKHCKLCL